METAPDSKASRSVDVLEFWFAASNKVAWFNSTAAFDAQIRARFEALWSQAQRGELDHWADTASGALALVTLLDQMPLNMYRGQAKSFSTEQHAVRVAEQSIAAGFDLTLSAEQKAFLYMPLMHSENRDDQDLSVASFERAGLTENLRFARHHREIVYHFGRFPHRNAILGRDSTAQELAYLASDKAFRG